MYLAPNLVLGSNKIGTHSPEEVLVGAAEDAVLVLRHDELRPPSPPPVPGHRQLPVLPPLPLLQSHNRATNTNPYDTYLIISAANHITTSYSPMDLKF